MKKKILSVLFLLFILGSSLDSLFNIINYGNFAQADSGNESYLQTLSENNFLQIEEPFAICHGHGGSINDAQNLAAIGVQASRNDITWAAVEQVEGIYNFEGYLNFYSNLKMAGVEPIAILDYGNPNLFGGEYKVRITEDQMESWLNYVDATVRYFMENITYWEIWNEPNLDGFWSGTDEEFFNLLNKTMRLIRSINPDLKIISSGISGHDPKYLDEMISYVGSTDFNDYIDILAFHPYSGSSAQSIRTKINEVWNVVHNHNFSGEVWITEVGYSTQVSTETALDELPGQFFIQARELVKSFSIGLAQNVSMVVWYCYSDWWDINRTYGEACFGIIYRPDSDTFHWEYKPSGYLYRKLSGLLTNSTYLPNAIRSTGFSLNYQDNEFQYYYKTTKNTSVVILWTQNMPYSAKIIANGLKNGTSYSLLDDNNAEINIENLVFSINSTPIILEFEWIDSDHPKNIIIQIYPNYIQVYSVIVAPIAFIIGLISIVFIKKRQGEKTFEN